MQPPSLFVLAGPNGAGKSTFYDLILSKKILAPFLNADEIQKHELKDLDVRASYRAAEIASERRAGYFKERKSFVFETVFSHPSKLELVREAKAAGFDVHLFHIGLASADLAVARVRKRTLRGGHDVPEEKIRSRFERNKPLIREAMGMADWGYVYDGSFLAKRPTLCLAFRQGQLTKIGATIPWVRELYAGEINSALRKALPQTGRTKSE